MWRVIERDTAIQVVTVEVWSDRKEECLGVENRYTDNNRIIIRIKKHVRYASNVVVIISRLRVRYIS